MAGALDAEEIVIGIADDGIGEESLTAALAERRMPVPTRIVTVPHRFISGEGGALVRGINGEAHIPPGRKVRSSDNGVAGLPTLLSNAETYAQLAIAARLGPWEYNAVGMPEEPGTVMLTVGGCAATGRPWWRCPTGTPLKDVLRHVRRRHRPGRAGRRVPRQVDHAPRRRGQADDLPQGPRRRSAARSVPASSSRSAPTPARWARSPR